MSSENFLVNSIARHQVFLEQFKSGYISDNLPEYLESIQNEYERSLLAKNFQKLGLSGFKSSLTDFKKKLIEINNNYSDKLINGNDELIEEESIFGAELLNNFIDDESAPVAKALSASALSSTIRNSVMSDSGKYPGDTMSDWSEKSADIIVDNIRNLYYQSKTSREIFDEVFEKSGDSYTSPQMRRVKNNTEAETLTMLQYLAEKTRAETSRRSGLTDGYIIVATLDRKTSDICRAVDMSFYEYGEGPEPPLHKRCRSNMVPYVKEQYKTKYEKMRRASNGSGGKTQTNSQTYYTWLRKQSKAFQEEVLGVTLTKVFRDGKISSEEFASMSLNRNFQPRTIQEMREVRPLAFENAGV